MCIMQNLIKIIKVLLAILTGMACIYVSYFCLYRCITRAVCHEIFVESLMCSGRNDYIRLAGTMLERSGAESKIPGGHKGHKAQTQSMDKVPYSRAVDLTLSAAREYFDSSANLSDPCMDLARACLNLILDAPPPIQAELDLIASLALLEEFKVPVLPLQVRISKTQYFKGPLLEQSPRLNQLNILW